MYVFKPSVRKVYSGSQSNYTNTTCQPQRAYDAVGSAMLLFDGGQESGDMIHIKIQALQFNILQYCKQGSALYRDLPGGIFVSLDGSIPVVTLGMAFTSSCRY